MKLSKKGEYALRSLIILGIAEEMDRKLVQVTELAESEQLPVKFLEQILHLLKEAKIQKGSQTPGTGTVGKITMDQVRKIAEVKMVDMNANDIDAAVRMLVGSARSMGLEVVGQ